MNSDQLVTIGLTPLQADAYMALLEQGQIKPPELAAKLGTTRTNTYKILDKLVELHLAVKTEQKKKFVYKPANPLALTNLTAAYRAEAVAREEAVSGMLHELLAQYHTHSDRPGVTVTTGKKEVVEAYKKQLSLREDLYFIHTRADVPIMGFDTMHEIRTTPARYNQKRSAIMSAPSDGSTINYDSHRRSNLEVTWRDDSAYTAPVEWSVTKSSLLIVLYGTEPHAILIIDTLVATAFMQLWNILNDSLRSKDTHHRLAR